MKDVDPAAGRVVLATNSLLYTFSWTGTSRLGATCVTVENLLHRELLPTRF
jgi:hypothetical protein